jgi:hypothetical protein
LIFKEYINLKLPKNILSEEQIFDKYINIVDSFKMNKYGQSSCNSLANAIYAAFAKLARIVAGNSGNGKAFYNLVIVPMLMEYSAECIGEV